MGKNTSIELIYEIASEVRKRINVMSREIDDELVMEEIQKVIMNDSRTEYLSLQEKKGVMEGAFNSLRRELDFLEKYLDEDFFGKNCTGQLLTAEYDYDIEVFAAGVFNAYDRKIYKTGESVPLGYEIGRAHV